MKAKIIDLLKLLSDGRLKEGFRFVYDNQVFKLEETKKDELAFLNRYGNSLGNCYKLDIHLNEEIEILTQDLILQQEQVDDSTDIYVSENILSSPTKSKKSKITDEDIDKILDASIIEIKKLGEKTTIVKVVLPNGFILVESSSCVDQKNFDIKIGEKQCMKKITDKIWELEGYRLQSLLWEEEK